MHGVGDIFEEREDSQFRGRRLLLSLLLLLSFLATSGQLIYMFRSSIPSLSSWWPANLEGDNLELRPCADEPPQRNITNLPPVNVSSINCPPETRYYTHNLLSYVEEEGILYSGVTKSGSSTIRTILKKMANGISPEETFKRRYRKRTGKVILPANRKVLFTFVRDPIERFLSAYAEVWRRGKFWFSGMPYANSRFTLPPMALKPEAMALFIDRLNEEGFWDGHLEPQTVKMTNMHLNGCLPFDFVGRLERFEEDFSHVLAMAEVKPVNWQKWSVNGGRKTPDDQKSKLRQIFWRQTQKRIKTICSVYSWDFVNFGYPYPDDCKGMNVTLQPEVFKQMVLTSLDKKNDRNVRVALIDAQWKWNKAHGISLANLSKVKEK